MTTLPEIDSAACVHALSPGASCRACVAACPTGAWLLDDDGLSLNTEACDGCALCVPACPREAISLPRSITILHDGHGKGTAFVTCERAPQTAAPAMPCVHAIGRRDLDALAAQDVVRLAILTGNCQLCTRNNRISLLDAVSAHHAIRLSTGQAAIAIEWCDTRSFSRAHARALEDHERVDRSKRRLFGFSAEKTPHAATSGTPLAYSVPHIEPTRCVACEACIRICPDGALSVQIEPPAYGIDPLSCTGCGLCVDACDQAAITVAHIGNAAKKAVALDLCRCRLCGAPYHTLAGNVSQGGDLCRICARTPHNKKLFQVFKD